MKIDDMVIVSADDHITEPGNVFDKHLSGKAFETAPKLRTTSDGSNYWEYEGRKIPSIGLNAVVGRPPEEYGMEPTSMSQLRAGCYDVHERIKDMNVNGIAASMNFASFTGLDGGLFFSATDKSLALQHMQAYNDWHIDEWCGAYPGRFIPCCFLPLWDMDASVAEVKRLASKGCYSISLNDNPGARGLPSIHTDYWEPLWKVVTDLGTTICLHIGSGHPPPHASMNTPIEAWITTMPMSISIGAADWLNLAALHRYPTMRIALSEGGIGWIPYFMERADFSHQQHHAWTHSNQYMGTLKPSDVFKRHFINCFIDDKFGMHNVDWVGEDNIAYECDYPHSDTLWPNAPEALWDSVKHLSDTQINKITHLNMMRDFQFDPFKHFDRAELTVGALRAKAKAQGVDTSFKSKGGANPLGEGEKVRPITSGDVVKMFSSHAALGNKG
jgi:predicted TIM-barrel fold metal-dependent hydrolase